MYLSILLVVCLYFISFTLPISDLPTFLSLLVVVSILPLSILYLSISLVVNLYFISFTLLISDLPAIFNYERATRWSGMAETPIQPG